MATAIVQALIIVVTWSETMGGVTGRADWENSHCDVMVLTGIQDDF